MLNTDLPKFTQIEVKLTVTANSRSYIEYPFASFSKGEILGMAFLGIKAGVNRTAIVETTIINTNTTAGCYVTSTLTQNISCIWEAFYK